MPRARRGDLRRDYSNVCGLLLKFNVLSPNKASLKICGPPPMIASSVFAKETRENYSSFARVIRKLKIESGQ